MTSEDNWPTDTIQKKIKLFFFLPIFSYKQNSDKKVWKICGLPVLKIRRKKGGAKLKYLLFGFIPLMIIKTKRG
ncbi:MAG: hypothetical protein J6C85_03130 [Alphaproteobacteria bacterium]|nr:hypothetical protein [Alphaproteobacteria bacterium]